MTTKLLHITDAEEISRVTELLHDSWIDADRILYDSSKGIITIRILKPKHTGIAFVTRMRLPANEYLLRISHVKSFDLQDTEKIRFYDLNELKFDPVSMQLEVETGVPIGIHAVVNCVDIKVEDSGTIVSH